MPLRHRHRRRAFHGGTASPLTGSWARGCPKRRVLCARTWPWGLGQALDLSFLIRSSKRTASSGHDPSSAEHSRPSPPSLRAHPAHTPASGSMRGLPGLTAPNAVSPQAGMIIDNGVKTTEASAKDKRPFLSVISAR